VLYPRR